MQELADHLVDGFFLSYKARRLTYVDTQQLNILFFQSVEASSARTPQPTPYLTPQPRQGGDILVGTTQHLSSLRGQCLVRDCHRCVISRQFDEAEAIQRFDHHGVAAVDDDEQLLTDEEAEHLDT